MSSQRIPVVEQLRGFAALAVTWFHLTNQYRDWVTTTGSWGWLGVEIFFVISGFVIPLSLIEDWRQRGARSVPLFLARRLVRIEPPYIASALMVVALNVIAAQVPGFRGTPQEVTAPQLLLHVLYLIPFSSYQWLQPVYWSLAYEFAFYLFTAMAFALLAAKSRTSFIALLIVLSLAIVTKLASPLLMLFAMGCTVFRAHAGLERRVNAILLILAAAISMVVADAGIQAAVGTITALVILSPACSFGIPGQLGNGLAWLGTISYSLYLVHVPIGGKLVNLGMRWLKSPLEHLLLSLSALALCVVFAVIFFRLIERPCIRAARALGARVPGKRGVVPGI